MGEWLLWQTALLHVFMLCFSVLDGFISLMDHSGVCMGCGMPAKFSPLRWPAQITGIQKWIIYLIILMGHCCTAYHTGALKWKTHQQWLHMHIYILFKRVTRACTQMHASPHTYTHTHTYTCIHTHTHTHTHINWPTLTRQRPTFQFIWNSLFLDHIFSDAKPHPWRVPGWV